MQGSTLAAKNVAFCSTDANSTIRWAYNRGGGEGGIRTHGRVSPTLAFEASSFNRSDTSPQLFSHSNGAATAGQPPVNLAIAGIASATITFYPQHSCEAAGRPVRAW